VIGQLAIRSQFAREASRILLSPSIASGDPCLTLPFLSHCFFVQFRVALRVKGSRRCAKSHRSQRHLTPKHDYFHSLFSFSIFSNEEAGVGGRAKSAPCERGTEAPFRHFPRSALARLSRWVFSKLVDTARGWVAGARDAGSGVQCLPWPSLMLRRAFASPVVLRACVFFLPSISHPHG